MRIDLGPFRGRLPRVSDRGLPRENATVATGCDMRSGEIRPFRKSALVQALGAESWGTIYQWWSSAGTPLWLQFPAGVDVIQGPVADDVWERIYWTGDSRFDEPRMSYTGPIQTGGSTPPNTSYKLGVPAPGDQLEVSPVGPQTLDIADIYLERPIRVETVTPHELRTGDIVQFAIQSNPPDEPDPGDDEVEANSLAEFMNDNDFQVRIINDNEFTLDFTDAANVAYTTFDTGTVSLYYPPETLTTRFYVHTYVTNIGEEGPPSDPSPGVEMGQRQPAELTLPALDPTDGEGRIIETRRIYRTTTGTRSAQFQFVGEVPITETEFLDDVDPQDLGEIIPSIEWDPPSQNLKGLRLAAQGFAVGFFDNVVAFSEPYQVHAWPTSYQVALDYEVVAVEVVDGAVVVATTGRPYILQGIEPRSMTPRRLEANYACISARSMVSMGFAAVFASSEGLVLVQGGNASLLTRSLMTEKNWKDFAPETIHAYAHQGRYVAFYDAGSGIRKGFILDPREAEQGLVDLSFYAKAGFVEPRERFLYLLLEDNSIVRWDDPEQDPEPWSWHSKAFVSPRPANMAAAKIAADEYPVTFRLVADGALRHTQTVQSAEPFRLPGGYLAREFIIQLEGESHVFDGQIAESGSELEP